MFVVTNINLFLIFFVNYVINYNCNIILINICNAVLSLSRSISVLKVTDLLSNYNHFNFCVIDIVLKLN